MIRALVNFEDTQYNALKEEAFQKRKSFSAVVRDVVDEKINQRAQKRSKVEVEEFMARIRKHAAESAKYLKGVDGVKIIREMRDSAKW